MAEKTEAQKKAQRKYMKGKATIQLVMEPERRETIQHAAASQGQSVNAYINQAIDERMKRDGGGTSAQAAVEASERTEGGGGILAPVTLETATEAAQKTGETVSAFLERAVSTQASRDALSLNMGLNPAQSAKDE